MIAQQCNTVNVANVRPTPTGYQVSLIFEKLQPCHTTRDCKTFSSTFDTPRVDWQDLAAEVISRPTRTVHFSEMT